MSVEDLGTTIGRYTGANFSSLTTLVGALVSNGALTPHQGMRILRQMAAAAGNPDLGVALEFRARALMSYRTPRKRRSRT
jgi:hypothetical protein